MFGPASKFQDCSESWTRQSSRILELAPRRKSQWLHGEFSDLFVESPHRTSHLINIWWILLYCRYTWMNEFTRKFAAPAGARRCYTTWTSTEKAFIWESIPSVRMEKCRRWFSQSTTHPSGQRYEGRGRQRHVVSRNWLKHFVLRISNNNCYF